MRDEYFFNENNPIVLINDSFDLNLEILEMASKKELSDKFKSELQKGLNAASPRISDINKVATLQNDIELIETPNDININWDLSIFSDNMNIIYYVNDYDKDFSNIQQQNQLKTNNSTSMGILLQHRINNQNQSSNFDNSSIHSSNILGSVIDEGSDSERHINIQYVNESFSEISSISENEEVSEFEYSSASNDCSMNQDENNSENISIGTSRSHIKRKILFKPKFILGNMIIYKSSNFHNFIFR